jgi:PTH1 family peptidyl-tRNA hydrolase
VIHDELDLPLGRMKLKYGGGAAGHNGVTSVAEELGATNFYRLRLGVGKPEYSRQAADYVLEPFSEQEAETALNVAAAAAKGLRIFVGRGYEPAAQFLNSYSPDEGEESA